MSDSLLIGAIGTAIGAIITALGIFIVNIKKQKHSENIDKDKFSLQVYLGVIESLKKDATLMAVDLAKLNDERLQYREKCAALTVENKYLQAEAERLAKEVSLEIRRLSANQIQPAP